MPHVRHITSAKYMLDKNHVVLCEADGTPAFSLNYFNREVRHDLAIAMLTRNSGKFGSTRLVCGTRTSVIDIYEKMVLVIDNTYLTDIAENILVLSEDVEVEDVLRAAKWDAENAR